MAIGKATDFKIYDELFYGGMYEGIAQVTAGFNAASLNCLRLVIHQRNGDFVKESFFKDLAGLIGYRDPTSLSTATDLAMTQGEFASVKVPRVIGPIAQTLDAWRRVGKDEQEMSYLAGLMIAQHKAMDFINTAIMVAVAALKSEPTTLFDASGIGAGTITHPHLVSSFANMGDRANAIRCIVMHSKQFFDLMQQSIADKIFEVAGVTIYQGTIATFGKPVLVLDSPALIEAIGSQTTGYNVLALVEGAVTVEESEEQDLVSQVITGMDNLVFRIQGEYAFNIGVKGFAYDYSGGGENPDDTVLGSSSSWAMAVSSIKNGPGSRLLVL